MGIELRRSQRYERFLPITVTAVDKAGKNIMAGPFQGRIINISRHGSCLLLSKVLANNFHLYYSTKENPSIILQLTLNIQPEIIDYNIMAEPVWMDIFLEGEIRAFIMGIEFLVNADDEKMLHLEQVINKR